MIFDLTQVVKNYDGTDVMQGEEDNKRPLTYRDLLTQTVNSTSQATPADEKVQAFFITKKAYDNATACELTVEEVAFVIRRVKEFGFPLGVGRAIEFFNNPLDKKPDEPVN